MKALKITLLLAIFCLTFSGQSPDANKNDNKATYKTNKVEFKSLAVEKAKTKLPSQA